jgi:hypothetical protein
MVGAEGFEPPTLCSQSRCATRLRYAPTRLHPLLFRFYPDSCLDSGLPFRPGRASSLDPPRTARDARIDEVHGGYSSAAERLTVAQDVVGSIPTSRPNRSPRLRAQFFLQRARACNAARAGSAQRLGANRFSARHRGRTWLRSRTQERRPSWQRPRPSVPNAQPRHPSASVRQRRQSTAPSKTSSTYVLGIAGSRVP